MGDESDKSRSLKSAEKMELEVIQFFRPQVIASVDCNKCIRPLLEGKGVFGEELEFAGDEKRGKG